MTFGKAVKSNVLQTSRFTHNLSNDVFISNTIINRGKTSLVCLGMRYVFLRNIRFKPPLHQFSQEVEGKGKYYLKGFHKSNTMVLVDLILINRKLIEIIFGSIQIKIIFGIQDNNSCFSHNIIIKS